MAERQIVDLVVEGSSPFFHPRGVRPSAGLFFAPVAQLDRASDFESAGRAFESRQAQPLTRENFFTFPSLLCDIIFQGAFLLQEESCLEKLFL